jgi:hypothetical protein
MAGQEPGLPSAALSLLFMAYVIFNWVTAPYFGPDRAAAGRRGPAAVQDRRAAPSRSACRLVWAYFIYTQIIKPIRQTGQPNTLGLLGVAFFFAIFWDPSMNFIQQGCVYNPYMRSTSVSSPPTFPAG